MIYFWLVILGLCLGSFVNALVWRLHEQEENNKKKSKRKKKLNSSNNDLSILNGRSMCPKCRHVLSAIDLVPVLSWFWLRGKCRYCHCKIEDNPVAEVLMPLLFILSFTVWPLDFQGWGLFSFFLWIIFLVGFTALALYDLRWYILPDRIVYPLIVVAALGVVVHLFFYNGGWQVIGAACWGMAVSSGIFYVLFQVSDGKWIGGGDVKLGLVLGLIVGGPLNSLLLLFLASMFGCIVSLPLLYLGKAKRDTLIPFGPFLLLATIVIVLFGTDITSWLNGFIIR
jgi:leader peptidase (prepilin peptidase) / N-methyltransferase